MSDSPPSTAKAADAKEGGFVKLDIRTAIPVKHSSRYKGQQTGREEL
jgi:hypothetical protein